MPSDATSARRRVAVIGAGVAGLAAARLLADKGHTVEIFDKGRGPGGRLATRRVDGFAFDHGAQYFTIKDARLDPYMRIWREQILVAPWRGRFGVLESGAFIEQPPSHPRWVAIPGMSGLARQLAADLDVNLSVRITHVTRERASWRLTDDGGGHRGLFDWLVVAVPPDQAIPLLQDASDLAARAAAAVMDPCWAAMLGFEAPLNLPFEGAAVAGSPLAWIARNDSKPGRKPGESLVLHANPAWSRDHLERAPEEVLPLMIDALTEALGRSPGTPVYATAHRWRYAQVANPCPGGPRFDASLGVGICGDWTSGPRIEAAWVSGLDLARQMLAV
jgi:predicted NAD/FAD-dependent oxidoreductase